MNDYLTAEQVAALKGVSAERIRRLCREGILKTDRLGRAWLIKRNSLEDYVPRPK